MTLTIGLVWNGLILQIHGHKFYIDKLIVFKVNDNCIRKKSTEVVLVSSQLTLNISLVLILLTLIK